MSPAFWTTSFGRRSFHHSLSLSPSHLRLFFFQAQSRTFKILQEHSRKISQGLVETRVLIPFDESSSSIEDRAVTRSYSLRWIWEEVPWFDPRFFEVVAIRDSERILSVQSITLETRSKDLSVRGKETRSFTSRLSQLGVLFFNYLITCSLIGFCCVKNESCLNSRLRLFTCHLWSKSCSLLLSFYSLFSSILVLNKLVKILQIQIPIQSINRQTKPTFQRQSVMTHWTFRHDAQEVSPLTFSLLFSPSWRTLPSVMTHRGNAYPPVRITIELFLPSWRTT